MAKQIEAVTGLVERINDKGTGVKVNGEWLNISAYHALAELPKAGQRVEVQVERTDRGIWIQSVEVLDNGQVHACRCSCAAAVAVADGHLRSCARYAA